MTNPKEVHYEILDTKRLSVLPTLAVFKSEFYLAGGTSLALQLGHRDSIDFDFFTKDSFDENKLVQRLQDTFKKDKVKITQLERGTVTAIIDGEIKLSFFSYCYDLIDSLVDCEHLKLASKRDIACMKLSAICSRSVSKDYVDLYFMLKDMSLESMLEDVKIKFPVIDVGVILKSLVYFEDVEEGPIIMLREKELGMTEVKIALEKIVKEYTDKNIKG